MSGSITIKDKKKGARVVKALLRKPTRARADKETGIPGAGIRFEKLEKRIDELESEVAVLRAQTADVWAWWKNTQEGK